MKKKIQFHIELEIDTSDPALTGRALHRLSHGLAATVGEFRDEFRSIITSPIMLYEKEPAADETPLLS